MTKRVWRNDMPQAQKDKISQANLGRTQSAQTRERIADSMRKYWSNLPYKPITATGTTSTSGTTPTV